MLLTAEVTSIDTAQLWPAVNVPPEIEKVVLATLNVAPVQLVTTPDGELNTRPAGAAGKVSLTAIPFKVCETFGFVTTKVSVEVPPAASAAGENILVIVGALSTIVVAVAGTESAVDSVVSMTALSILPVAELI